MTAVDIWDVRAEFEHVVPAEQRAVQTPRDEGFVQRRRLWPAGRGEIRTFQLIWNTGIEGDAWRVWNLWDVSFGGTLTLTYTPQDGSGAIEVSFMSMPEVERVNFATYRMRVVLEEVL